MANSDDESKAGPAKPAVPGVVPKKPAAILDLKASGVEISGGSGNAAAAPSAGGDKPVTEGQSKEAGVVYGPGRQDASGKGAAAGARSAAASPSAPGPGHPDGRMASSGVDGPAGETIAAVRGGSGFTGFLTHLAAGVAGGMLALIGADSLNVQLQGTTRAGPGPGVEFAERLAALEQKASGTSGVVTGEMEKRLRTTEARLDEISDLNRALATLKQSQEALAKETAALAEKGAGGNVDGDVSVRIGKMEEAMRALASVAGSEKAAGRIPQLAALSGRIADVETALENRVAALRKSLGEELNKRTGPVAETSEAARAGTIRLDREFAGLKSGTEALAQTVAGLDKNHGQLQQSLEEIKGQGAGRDKEIAGLRERLQSELKSFARPGDVTSAMLPLTSKISAVEQSLNGLMGRETERQANVQRIVLALELGNLKRVVDRGDAYGAELAEVRKAAAGKLDLAALERFKDAGVPTLGRLTNEFKSLSHAIIAADAAPADGSLIDRLLSGAKSVVKIRRVGGDVTGDSAEAVVARMEAALEGGQLGKVIETSRALSARALIPAAKEWLEKVKARGAAYSAISDIEQQLKATLAAGSSGPPAVGTGR